MALISGSALLGPAVELSDEVAVRDIVERNQAGQNVVVVPRGQRIPKPLLPLATEQKAVTGPPETKAVRAAPATKKAAKPKA